LPSPRIKLSFLAHAACSLVVIMTDISRLQREGKKEGRKKETNEGRMETI
jgi:hypothetical protein